MTKFARVPDARGIRVELHGRPFGDRWFELEIVDRRPEMVGVPAFIVRLTHEDALSVHAALGRFLRSQPQEVGNE